MTLENAGIFKRAYLRQTRSVHQMLLMKGASISPELLFTNVFVPGAVSARYESVPGIPERTRHLVSRR